MSNTENKVKLTVGQVREMWEKWIRPKSLCNLMNEEIKASTTDTETVEMTASDAKELLDKNFSLNGKFLPKTEIGQSIQAQLDEFNKVETIEITVEDVDRAIKETIEQYEDLLKGLSDIRKKHSIEDKKEIDWDKTVTIDVTVKEIATIVAALYADTEVIEEQFKEMQTVESKKLQFTNVDRLWEEFDDLLMEELYPECFEA